ncbi:MAG: hypothetical protein Q9201_005857 [Fulgogasparrea decipioides]
MRYAELKPNLAPSLFPSQGFAAILGHKRLPLTEKTANHNSSVASPSTVAGDGTIYDDGVEDGDMFEAAMQLDFNPIEAFEAEADSGAGKTKAAKTKVVLDQEWTPTQLESGKWECNHKCKNKKACKHLCCHEGIDKPPKAPKKASVAASTGDASQIISYSKGTSKQNTISSQLHPSKAAVPEIAGDVERMDLAHTQNADEYAKVAPRAYRSLHKLHEQTNKNSKPSAMSNTKPTFSYKKGEQPTFTFLSHMDKSSKRDERPSSDYESSWMDDLPSPSALLQTDSGKSIGSKENARGDGELPYKDATSTHRDDGRDDDGLVGAQLRINCSARGPATFMDDEYEETLGNYGFDEGLEVSQYFKEGQPAHTRNESDDAKLFMSTDSPEKLPSPPFKRRATESPARAPLETDALPRTKRPKCDATAVPHNSSSVENEAQAPATTTKSSHPDRIDEFDPACLAEWEQYVEFV